MGGKPARQDVGNADETEGCTDPGVAGGVRCPRCCGSWVYPMTALFCNRAPLEWVQRHPEGWGQAPLATFTLLHAECPHAGSLAQLHRGESPQRWGER